MTTLAGPGHQSPKLINPLHAQNKLNVKALEGADSEVFAAQLVLSR